MKIIRISAVPAEEVSSPLFTGGRVTRQTLVTEEMGRHLNMGVVSFKAGARNKFHTHSSDQVLLVTAGRGIVATEGEERVVTVGDLIHIPAGEKHWHGATRDSDFAHITVTQAGSQTQQLEH